MPSALEQTEIVVIGAGVVGLAVARAVALAGREVLILEAGPAFGTGISSRNSEVIHAGIYYPQGSLKARLCVAGRDALYAYCSARGVAHRQCGKLIVATHAGQLPALTDIQTAAACNGVTLEPLDGAEARRLEPALKCSAALHSPLTGIIDSHEYMLALLADAEARGATLACNSDVQGMWLESTHVALAVNDSKPSLQARAVINCAGLSAPAVARSVRNFPAEHVPRSFLAKGHYFTLSGRSPFQRLVYPLPEPGGLGVHVTLDLAGRTRFGPDVQWIGQPDHTVDPARAQHFQAAIRAYWPELPDNALTPAYAGIRPKLTGPGEPPADFRIDARERHGVRQIINLFGIESPGLTASLAIADYTATLLAEQLD